MDLFLVKKGLITQMIFSFFKVRMSRRSILKIFVHIFLLQIDFAFRSSKFWKDHPLIGIGWQAWSQSKGWKKMIITPPFFMDCSIFYFFNLISNFKTEIPSLGYGKGDIQRPWHEWVCTPENCSLYQPTWYPYRRNDCKGNLGILCKMPGCWRSIWLV